MLASLLLPGTADCPCKVHGIQFVDMQLFTMTPACPGPADTSQHCAGLLMASQKTLQGFIDAIQCNLECTYIGLFDPVLALGGPTGGSFFTSKSRSLH